MGNEPARQLICLIAEKNKEDTALDWINSLVWDGVPRIKDFYPKILKTADTEYEREVGLYQWTAMAGRILEPGIKADMTPVWIGKQGTRKSTAVGAMVPYDSGFWSVDLHKVGDKDQARYARGKLIGEMAEMKGLASSEGDSIKAWLTQTEDEIVEKYKSQATKRKRRCIFIGTHNHNRFLRDLTGNRRWLPVAVAKTGKIDTDYIRANRDQLWAEAAVLFRESGIAFQRAEELAEPYQRSAVIRDPWYSKALEVLTSGDVKDVTVANMFSNMQNRGLNDLTLAIEHRIKNCLYSCGYEEIDDVWVLPDLA
jgi:predicted P-loop ATPase